MGKNKEIELKLLLSKNDIKKMLALECVAPYICEDSMKQRRLISSYYDTENLDFKNNGIAYRVRDKGDGTCEATVKTSNISSSGLSERLELNLPLPGKRAVLNGFAELGLGYELSDIATGKVKKLFTVNVQRTTYIIDAPDAVVELAIDHGKITAGKAHDAIDEVELELMEGSTAGLLRLAANIAQQVPVFVEKRSKYARGLVLINLESDEQSVAEDDVKLHNGEVKGVLVQAVAKATENLLDIQQQMLAEECEFAPLLKALRRNLLKLHAFVKLGEAVTGAEADITSVNDVLAMLDRGRYLRSLNVLWEQLLEQSGELLGRTSLQRPLTEAYIANIVQLNDMAEAGYFTALTFAVQSAVLGLPWGKVTVADAADVVKKAVLTLQNAGTAEALEDAYVLAGSCEGKAFAKLAAGCKKQRRAYKQQAKLAAWQELLAEIGTKSTGKLTHRDIGVLLGFLLAHNRL